MTMDNYTLEEFLRDDFEHRQDKMNNCGNDICFCDGSCQENSLDDLIPPREDD